MTIRQRINIDDKLKQFDGVLSGNGAIRRQQNWNVTKENIVPPSYQSYSHKTCEKEKRVKEIEDRINNIMKKHEDGGQFESHTMPLTPINKYLNQYEKGSIHLSTVQTLSASSNTRAFSEFRRVKGAVGNGQTNKVNQKSPNRVSNCIVTKEKQNSKNQSRFDSQINQLNQRIKKVEEHKKKLNIDFQPFCPIKNQQMSHSQLQQSTKFVNNNIKQQKFLDHHRLQKSQPKLNLFQNNYKIIEPFQLPKSSSILSQIATLFCEQIKIDQNFRNLKSWITLSNDPNKWKGLHNQLLKRNIAMTMEECKQTFSSTTHEHSPFFKSGHKDSITGLVQLIDAYELSDSFWKGQLFRKWKRSQLQPQHLEKAFFIHEKREIELEDLVRFVNMEAHTFYRNRDMFLIFKRLARKGSSTLSIINFIESLTAP